MKHGERAIEIAAIGLGQAGGNLAAEFFRRGYRAVALNTATTDLSSLAQSVTPLPDDARLYVGLKGYDGAGSDIAYGRECIRTHADSIRAHVANHATNVDVLLVTAGLGGGTGSAVTELVHALAELSLPTIVLATLPTGHESGIAKVNAMRAMNELIKETSLGLLLVDNSRLAQHHGGFAYNRYYTEINRMIVEPIDAFNRLNSRSDLSSIRSLDGEDYRNLLLSSGLLSFATATLSQLTIDAAMRALRDGLRFSEIQPEGYHLHDMSYLAVVIEAPEHMLAETPFSLFEQLSEQLKEETQGAGIFTGIYRTAAPQAHATVRVFASAQALPDGVQEIVSQAKREGGELQAKLQRAPSALALGEIEDFQLFRSGPSHPRRRIVEASRSQGAALPPTAAKAPPDRALPRSDERDHRVAAEPEKVASGDVRRPPPPVRNGVRPASR